MIKAIVFDCFGVLYVHGGPEYLKNNAANYLQIKNQLKNLSLQTDYGLISQKEYEQAVADVTGLPLDQVSAHILRGFVRNNSLLDYIENQLRPHFKIGLLSNISIGTMDRFFSEKEREQLFDTVVLSGETGLIKPNPIAYEYICKQLGKDTSEVIMIDDNYDNCRGAEQTGLVAIEYDGFAHLRSKLDKLLPKI